MEEVSPPVDLVLIQLRDELQVYFGCLTGCGSLSVVVVSCLVKPLPGAELFALRCPYHEVWLLFPNELPGSYALTAPAEVPR